MQKALPAEKNPTQNYLGFFKPKIKKMALSFLQGKSTMV
jgi:hypothetical protein